MPRPKLACYWEKQIKTVAANMERPTPTMVQRELEKHYRELPPQEQDKYGDPPSYRTVKRRLDAFPNEDRLPYRFFSWPESMGTPDLPWEASRPLLDLLAYLHHNDLPRPLNKVATWFWRIALAAPDAGEHEYDQHIRYLLVLAGHMALLDFQGKLSHYEETAPLQWVLSYAPWRSDDAKKRYATAYFRDRMPGPRPVHQQAETIQMPKFFGSFSGNLVTMGTELAIVLGYTVGAELATRLGYVGPEELQAVTISILEKATDEAIANATELMWRALLTNTEEQT